MQVITEGASIAECETDTDVKADNGPELPIVREIETLLKNMIDQSTTPAKVWQLLKLFFVEKNFSLKTGIPEHLLIEAGTRIMKYAELLKNKVDHLGLFYNAGVMLESTGRQDDALACFKEIFELQPHDSEICMRIARHWDSRGESGRYVAWLRKALDIDPTNVEILHTLGMRMFIYGRWRDSLDVFGRYLMFTDNTTEKDTRPYRFARRTVKYLEYRIELAGDVDKYSGFQPGEAV